MTLLRIALAGLAALAVAMGIGRFAFTPILPMMLHDGVVDLQRGSWLASTNYIGYLVGAVLCTLDPWLRPRLGMTLPWPHRPRLACCRKRTGSPRWRPSP